MRLAITLCSLGMSMAAYAASPIADAAAKGDKITVRTLIQQKADVNAPQSDGATALQWAAYRNDVELADVLIAAGANAKLANREGVTALQLASLNGSGPMIEKLIKAGADPNEKSPRGETPIMMAARSGNVDAIKVLADNKADLNAAESIRGTTALMWATEQGHAAAIKALIERGADVKAATGADTKGNRAYLAPTVVLRARSDQGAGGLRQNQGKQGGRNGARGQNSPGRGGADVGAAGDDFVARADDAAFEAAFGRQNDKDGGGLTALVYAAKMNCLECAKELINGGADVNQVTHFGWSPLLTATKNGHYKLATYLLEKGADPKIANKVGWTPLYLATDNRNIEGGDYPAKSADMDHLEFIKLLLAKGADVNARVGKDGSTETRTIFTMQWLYEDGATPFWRASQSADLPLMKLLLEHGADPKIGTNGENGGKVSPLEVAAGIGWVEGVTFEWSEKDNLEAIRMLLDLGLDPNNQDTDGRTPLHGAAHKGRLEVIKLLVERGAKLDTRDFGSRDTINGAMVGITWMPLHYAQGLVRVGVQSAIAHPEAAALIKQLMIEKGLKVPEDISSSICLTKVCSGIEQ